MLRLLLAVCLAFSGCGQDKKKKDDRPTGRPAPISEGGFGLQGLEATTWLSVCIASDSGNSSVQTSYQLQNETMIKSSKFFDYAECKTEELYAERVVNYDTVSISSSTKIAGSKLVSSVIASMQFISRKEAFTASINKESVYGQTDWITNEPKDIAGKSYSTQKRAEWVVGETLELIYKIENEKMYFAYFDDKNTPYYKDDDYFLKQ